MQNKRSGKPCDWKTQKDPKVTLGILGCMAQNRGSNLSNEIKGVNLIVGTQKFHRVSEYLDKVSSGVDNVRVFDRC